MPAPEPLSISECTVQIRGLVGADWEDEQYIAETFTRFGSVVCATVHMYARPIPARLCLRCTERPGLCRLGWIYRSRFYSCGRSRSNAEPIWLATRCGPVLTRNSLRALLNERPILWSTHSVVDPFCGPSEPEHSAAEPPTPFR